MRFIDPKHPFYRPQWRRHLIVGICFGWSIIEFSLGQTHWAALVAALGGYLAWIFIVRWRDEDHGEGNGEDNGGES